MKNKKELVISVLAMFCLTATLFMVVPTRSQTGSYDSRTDANGDGSIDMADLQLGIDNFMTYGDPTLNVNVTNWPTTNYTLIHGTLNMSSDNMGIVYTANLYSGAWSRLSLVVGPWSANLGANGRTTIYLYNVQWVSYGCYANDNFGSNRFNFTMINSPSFSFLLPATTFITETKAPYFSLLFYHTNDLNLPASWWAIFDYIVYLRNE